MRLIRNYCAKISLDVSVLKIDLMSLSAHKFYGPKGVGALYVRRIIQRELSPQIHGGGHERGMRSGTLPTHQIVGMGKAAQLAIKNYPEESHAIEKLRDRLWQGIKDLPGVKRNAATENVGAGYLNVCFAGVEGESLLLSLRELAVSTGSACTSASVEPSYVLKAMGVSDSDALSSIRITLGRYTTIADIDRAINHICQVVSQLQAA